jgi:hypothetical protein
MTRLPVPARLPGRRSATKLGAGESMNAIVCESRRDRCADAFLGHAPGAVEPTGQMLLVADKRTTDGSTGATGTLIRESITAIGRAVQALRDGKG